MGEPRLFTAGSGSADAPDPEAAAFAALARDNLAAGCDAIERWTPSAVGVDESDDDPDYRVLYTRLWAMMSDGSIIEHLACGLAVLDRPTLGPVGARWVVAAADRWHREATRVPDYGNAYTIAPLLKSLAVGFEAFHGWMAPGDRDRVAALLADLARTLWDGWFTRPDVAGRTGIEEGLHSAHHAALEWSAFGVAAVALDRLEIGTSAWVDASAEHFRTQLLPRGLRPDGAPEEGWHFWVTTMFSRVQFADALHAWTGEDLFAACPWAFRTDMAHALSREVTVDLSEHGEDRLDLLAHPLLPRPAAGALAWIAARSADPDVQRLAMLDRGAGGLIANSFTVPDGGARCRSVLNSYAALWFDATVAPARRPDPAPRAFPCVNLAAAPRGWRRPDPGLAVAVNEGCLHVWVGEHLVHRDLAPVRSFDVEASRRAGTGVYSYDPPELFGLEVGAWTTAGGEDVLEARRPDGDVVLRVVVSRDGRRARVGRLAHGRVRFQTVLAPTIAGGAVVLRGPGHRVRVTPGTGRFEVAGSTDPDRIVGYGLLRCDIDGTHPELTEVQYHPDAVGGGWTTTTIDLEATP